MWIHRSRDRDLLDFYAKTQMGRAFLMSRRFGVVIIVEHRMNLFLCPHPPSSTPDRYQTPRVFGVSSNPVDFPQRFSSFVARIVSNRTHSRLHADEYSRTMLVKTKKRPRLYCTYYERKYVLSLPTIVRANDRRPKIGTDEGQRVGFLRDNAKRCRLCNCNKRI